MGVAISSLELKGLESFSDNPFVRLSFNFYINFVTSSPLQLSQFQSNLAKIILG
jgi:hypothetical protein